MAKTETVVIGSLLIVVLAILLILTLGYAFSGEEPVVRNANYEMKHVPFVFVRGLFEDDIVQPSSINVATNTCGHLDTFINYDLSTPVKDDVIVLDSVHVVPGCDCDVDLFLNRQNTVVTEDKKSYSMVHSVPLCGEGADLFVTHTSQNDVGSQKSSTRTVYYQPSCVN